MPGRIRRAQATPGKQNQVRKRWRYAVRLNEELARGTSAYAFDGSGKVTRDRDNYSMCTFTSGKRYHCDLSASYNIGARYWIREILKSLPVTEGSLLEAEVPSVKRRSRCVYEDFLLLNKAMRSKGMR